LKAMPGRSKKQANRRADLTRKAYLGIRRMLFHNEIVPGQKIGYRDLSERLGMSQTPVIQALKWLEFQQLVRREPNRGYYTEPVSTREVEEIYDLRGLIETSLLPKTIERLDRSGEKELKKALADHQQAAGNEYLHDRLVRDKAFHLCLASLSGCRVQLNALTNLFDLLYLKYGGNILFSTAMNKPDAVHETIVTHVCQRDLERAQAVLGDHIRAVKAHVLAGLDRMIREKKISAI